VNIRRHFLLCLIGLAAGTPCAAEPAHFWLSASSTSPGGPEAPTLNIPISGTGQIHIWGRPATDRKFANLSLNLVATQPGIDFLDTGIVLYNAINTSLQRFESVADGGSVPALQSTRTRSQVVAGQADGIRGFQGFTLLPSPTIRGIGTKCVSGETGCFVAADGEPAWLIASASFTAIQPGSSTPLFLQVGEHGINQETVLTGDHDFNGVVERADYDLWQRNFDSNTALFADANDNNRVDAADYVLWREHLGLAGVLELSNLTSVSFGVGPMAGVPEPMYNAATNRQTTLTSDHADAVIQVAASATSFAATTGFVPEPESITILLAGALLLAIRRPNLRRSSDH
jgi:hypothetical protein